MDNYSFKLYKTYLRNEVVLSATSLNHFYFSLIKTRPLCWLEVVLPIKKGLCHKEGWICFLVKEISHTSTTVITKTVLIGMTSLYPKWTRNTTPAVQSCWSLRNRTIGKETRHES
jgi:hypothetical protein